MSQILDPRLGPLTKDDLQFNYPPGAATGDNPNLRGTPDNVLLNRHEWYEMLYFCNKFAIDCCKERDLASMVSFAKRTERIVQRQAPDYLRSQTHIIDWLKRNWDFFQHI
ncbi:hypothetical protein [Undibacterium macrobrachii]|uniref:Uncharacterized protein n=1 Tax=Undibacterium macrobrachii TaxID=1119058 RepID=A0ABQ2X6A1_9BURK|nr:hypothetical protein [Undibacterium macrobrachii]GGX01364.1 hypothetical protein GCM10011282_04100 [Undibacterium macrobrachii]